MHFAIDDQEAMISNQLSQSPYTESMTENYKIVCKVKKYVNKNYSYFVNPQNFSFYFHELGGETTEQFENSFINVKHANQKKVRRKQAVKAYISLAFFSLQKMYVQLQEKWKNVWWWQNVSLVSFFFQKMYVQLQER